MDSQTAIVDNPLEQFATYRFDTDETYQQGIAGILASLVGKSDAEREELLLRSRVFYFNRITGASIDIDEARRTLENAADTAENAPPSSSGVSTNNASASDEEPRMLSFAELKELIEQGKTDQIPNNRKIPNEFAKEPASTSTAPIRKKPWEAQGHTFPS